MHTKSWQSSSNIFIYACIKTSETPGPCHIGTRDFCYFIMKLFLAVLIGMLEMLV